MAATRQSRVYVNPNFPSNRTSSNFEPQRSYTNHDDASDNNLPYVDDTDGSSVAGGGGNERDRDDMQQPLHRGDNTRSNSSGTTTTRYAVTNVVRSSYQVQDSTVSKQLQRPVNDSGKPPVSSPTRRSNIKTAPAANDEQEFSTATPPRARPQPARQPEQQQQQNSRQQQFRPASRPSSNTRIVDARPIDQYVNIPPVSRSAQTLREAERQQPLRTQEFVQQQRQTIVERAPAVSSKEVSHPPAAAQSNDVVFPRSVDELRGEMIEAVVRKRDTGLGVTIVGGENDEPLQVRSLVPGGAADASGVLQPGDVLVNINGMNVLNFTHDMIISVFKAFPVGQDVNIVACRGYPLFVESDEVEAPTEYVQEYAVDDDEPMVEQHVEDDEPYDRERQHQDRQQQWTPASTATAPAQSYVYGGNGMSESTPNLRDDNVEERAIPIRKGSSGFGFTIEPSKSTGYQKIKKITDVGRCGDLREGDLLIQIDDQPLTDYSHNDIASILRHYPPHQEATFWVLRTPLLRAGGGNERQSRRRLSMSLPRTRSRSSLNNDQAQQDDDEQRQNKGDSKRNRSRSNSRKSRPKSANPPPSTDGGDRRKLFSGLFGKPRKQPITQQQFSSEDDDGTTEQPVKQAAVEQPNKAVKKFEHEQIVVQQQTFEKQIDDKTKVAKKQQQPALLTQSEASDRFRISSGGKPLPSSPSAASYEKQTQTMTVTEPTPAPAAFSASSPQLLGETATSRPRSRTPVTNQLARLVTPIFVTASRYTSPNRNKPKSPTTAASGDGGGDVVTERIDQKKDAEPRQRAAATAEAPAAPTVRYTSEWRSNSATKPLMPHGIEKTNNNNVTTTTVTTKTTTTKTIAPINDSKTANSVVPTGQKTSAKNSQSSASRLSPVHDDGSRQAPHNTVRIPITVDYSSLRKNTNQSNNREVATAATQQQVPREPLPPSASIRPWVPLVQREIGGNLPTAARFESNSVKRYSRHDDTGQSPTTTTTTLQTPAVGSVPDRLQNTARNGLRQQKPPTTTMREQPQQQQQKLVGFEKSILLKSQANGGFGFRVVGGSEDGSPVTVGFITPGGAADRDGRLRVGDELLAVDNTSTVGARHDDTVEHVRRAAEGGMILLLVLRRFDDINDAEPASSSAAAVVNHLVKPLRSSSEQAQRLSAADNVGAPKNNRQQPVSASSPSETQQTDERRQPTTLPVTTDIGVLVTKRPVEIIKVTLSRREHEGFGFVLVSSAPVMKTDESQQWIAETRTQGATYHDFDSYPMVGRIMPNTPADRCEAIGVGDRLLRVNNVDVYNFEHKRVVELIKNAGTTIALTIAAAAATGPQPRSPNRNEENQHQPDTYYKPQYQPTSAAKQQQQQDENSGSKNNRALYSRISSYISSRAQRESSANSTTNKSPTSTTTSTPPHKAASKKTVMPEKAVIREARATPVERTFHTMTTDDDEQHHYQNISTTRTATPAPPAFIRSNRDENVIRVPTTGAMRTTRASLVSDVMYESVELPRGPHGFGFSLRGGSEFESTPLSVLNIADDGPAAAATGSMRSGDEVVEINGVRANNLTHAEAIGMIRDGPDVVRLLLKRRRRYGDDDANADDV